MKKTALTLLSLAALLTVNIPAFAQEMTPGFPQKDVKVTKAPSGLRYQDLVVGTGAAPKLGQRVIVNYTGWLTNGTKFDSSLDRNEPFSFTLGKGEVIKGWDEGVASMKIGGKRKLLVPAILGYGSRGAGNVIPPNATLIFEVHLLGVQ